MTGKSVLLLVLGGVFVWSLMALMALREEIHTLESSKVKLLDKRTMLHSQQRELRLEYSVLISYAEIRQQAIALGMKDPQIDKGSWVFLSDIIGEGNQQ